MKTIFKIALIAFLWMLVINPLRIIGDTSARLQMAHAWWTGTDEVTLASDYKPNSRLEAGQGVLGRGGKRYIPYDVGQSLLMLPGDWLGSQLHKVVPQQNEEYLRQIVVSWVIFLPLNVILIIACFLLLKKLDFSEEVAGISSIILLLSTTVLHYAQSPQQNNQILLFVVLGYAAILASLKTHKSIYKYLFVFLSGLALGASILIRQTSVIHMLTVFVFLAGCVWVRQNKIGEVFKYAILWIIGLIPLILVGRIFDYVRFGVFWTTGASLGAKQLQTDPFFAGLPQLPANFPFSNPPWVGIWGVLFSPAKSIFIYDPLLLPCLLLGVFLWKKLSPYLKLYLIANVLNLLLHIALYARLDFWHGDAAWGARYHVTSLHLLLIPLIALLVERLLSARGLYLWSIRLLIVIGIFVQIPSIVLRPSAETGEIYFAQPSSFMKFRLAERIANTGCLIHHSFSPDCSKRLALDSDNPLITKSSLWPLGLTKSRNLGFTFWGFILSLAVLATIFWLFIPLVSSFHK